MNNPEAELILRQDDAGTATLTLNRPGARNALSRPLMAALLKALDEIDADESVHVVIIAGAGPGFCAGHDLREVRGDPTREAYEALFAECSRLMMRFNPSASRSSPVSMGLPRQQDASLLLPVIWRWRTRMHVSQRRG